MEQKIGHYSFVIGVVIALVLGIAGSYMMPAEPWLISLLIVLGLVVGFVNITGKETKEFLLVAAILAIVLFVNTGGLGLGNVKIIGPYLEGIVKYIMAFVVPATIVVALKDVYRLGQYS